MKRYFEISYHKLIRFLLPTFLRDSPVITILGSVTTEFDNLHKLFKVTRENNLYDLSITPQVCYLEKALNDRFDKEQRRIYITDGIVIPKTYLFIKPENIKLYLFTKQENKPIELYTKTDYELNDYASSDYDFIVNVPSDVVFEEKEMGALLDRYKLASKSYSINIIS